MVEYQTGTGLSDVPDSDQDFGSRRGRPRDVTLPDRPVTSGREGRRRFNPVGTPQREQVYDTYVTTPPPPSVV